MTDAGVWWPQVQIRTVPLGRRQWGEWCTVARVKEIGAAAALRDWYLTRSTEESALDARVLTVSVSELVGRGEQ